MGIECSVSVTISHSSSIIRCGKYLLSKLKTILLLICTCFFNEKKRVNSLLDNCHTRIKSSGIHSKRETLIDIMCYSTEML